jgi:hypothetical protein
MDINNVSGTMSNYYMGSMVNTLTSSNNSNESVPLVGSIDAFVQGNNDLMKLKGISQNTQLQDILNIVDPSNGLVNNSAQSPPKTVTDLQNSSDLNLLSQLNGTDNSSIIDNNVLSIYNSLENGTFTPNSTSITTSDPATLYSNVNSMTNQYQTTGNFFSATA